MVATVENPVVGDLYLENGTVRLTQSLEEETVQDLYIALSLFQGEWFLDPAQGMPYFQSILGQKTPLNIIVQIFRRAILTRPGVSSLTSLKATRVPPRGVRLDFVARLIDGTVLDSASFAPFVVGS